MKIFLLKVNKILKLDKLKFNIVPNIKQSGTWDESDFDIFESNRVIVDSNSIIVSYHSDEAPIQSLKGYLSDEKVTLIACVNAVAQIEADQISVTPNYVLKAVRLSGKNGVPMIAPK